MTAALGVRLTYARRHAHVFCSSGEEGLESNQKHGYDTIALYVFAWVGAPLASLLGQHIHRLLCMSYRPGPDSSGGGCDNATEHATAYLDR